MVMTDLLVSLLGGAFWQWSESEWYIELIFGLHGKVSTSCSSYLLCQCDVDALGDWLDSSHCV
jgi:hypothetical protein